MYRSDYYASEYRACGCCGNRLAIIDGKVEQCFNCNPATMSIDITAAPEQKTEPLTIQSVDIEHSQKLDAFLPVMEVMDLANHHNLANGGG